MDASELAKDLAAYLPFVLPYLLKIGGKIADNAADDAGKKIAGSAWDSLKRVWAKLCPQMEAEPTAKGTIADVVEAPQDPDAQAALRLQLKRLLAADPKLAAEVETLWNEAKKAGVAAIGERSVAINGSVSNGVIVTGDHNQVKQSK